jgi:hypothetical protein
MMGQLLYYMGEDHIVYGSDSVWYGGPQWQIEAFWRFQIPERMRERWGYPRITERAKRKILGLTSARLYGLPTGDRHYRDGGLRHYARTPELQPGGRVDEVLTGVGYPTRVVPAIGPSNDRFSQIKSWSDEMKLGRSNTCDGWYHT